MKDENAGAPSMIGHTFGHYHIVEKIGEGGMGVVYKARDLRLGREVAIKALPDAFAYDVERLARFEREAQILASLNHPHIAAVYGLVLYEMLTGRRAPPRRATGDRPAARRAAVRDLPRRDALRDGPASTHVDRGAPLGKGVSARKADDLGAIFLTAIRGHAR
jgi:hypothetical protein